jgi:hypothetical protein
LAPFVDNFFSVGILFRDKKRKATVEEVAPGRNGFEVKKRGSEGLEKAAGKGDQCRMTSFPVALPQRMK